MEMMDGFLSRGVLTRWQMAFAVVILAFVGIISAALLEQGATWKASLGALSPMGSMVWAVGFLLAVLDFVVAIGFLYTVVLYMIIGQVVYYHVASNGEFVPARVETGRYAIVMVQGRVGGIFRRSKILNQPANMWDTVETWDGEHMTVRKGDVVVSDRIDIVMRFMASNHSLETLLASHFK